MRRSGHPMRWLPPFTLGVAAATAAEVAGSLLLYAGPGLIRSLTTILSVEALALSFGVVTAPGPRPDVVDSLRRRWLLCLLAFMAATLFSAFWSVIQAIGGSALGQGVGLAVLAAFPMYSVGGVLGGMASASVTESGDRPATGAGAALLGGAVGFAVTGITLPQSITPASLLLICLVLLSAGGLVYGSVLDTRLHVHVRARRPSPSGDVRVEDRHLLSKDTAARVLMEGDFVRSWVTLADDERCPWDRAVCDTFTSQSPSPDLLFVGGGASGEARSVVRESPSTRVEVLERSGAVLELAREHLDTGLSGDADPRLVVSVGNIDDALERSKALHGIILLDTGAFGPVGGMGSIGASTRSRMFGRVDTGGVVALGPWRPEAGAWSFPEGWSSARYRRDTPGEVAVLGLRLPEREWIWVGSPDPAYPWPDVVGPYTRLEEGGA